MMGTLFSKYGFVVAMLCVGGLIYFSYWVAKKFLRNKIPGSAIAIFIGLILAYIGGVFTGGKNGIADVKIFSGFALLGGAMFRDFTIVSTAMGADFEKIKKSGIAGFISLTVGLSVSFIIGSILAYFLGYRDAISMATIGAGACTFVIGPVTGGALGASSEVITISIAAGVIKSILVTIGTPLVARMIGLNNPHTAMIYGGMIGTTSGVAAGLAATDPALVPYGSITATFYTGLGCLLCPSVYYIILQYIIS
ncbi:MAG: malonate transporter subunit MadM [Saprospiraceae bacterium]|nr:malonate transporter subunit MadM [Saprospiraceae bacterium]